VLEENLVRRLEGEKNLLAFSAGVDSTALFFLLLEHHIKFDIALVNYGLREQAKEEELYALSLAKKYDLTAYTTQAPTFEQNFEKSARDFRYAFFDELVEQHAYDNLLTAHQLNDQLEWFLMRLTKGAGVSELIGLEMFSQRKNHTLVRPLLNHSKDELLDYLESHHYHYFVDESNANDKYERNRFRKEFANELMKNYAEGIRHSFGYLRADKDFLEQGVEEIYHEKSFYLLSVASDYLGVRAVDQVLKKLGCLLSASQRARVKEEESIVFGHQWAVERVGRTIFIAPYRTSPLPKKFKEACRRQKIPPKVRAYLFEEGIELTKLAI
jgi:tRNA(Ile)-lysidine synthase